MKKFKWKLFISCCVLTITLALSISAFPTTINSLLVGGRYTYGDGITLVQCSIKTPDFPAVYADSASCAWIMNCSADGTKYIQSGWIKSNNAGEFHNDVHFWVQICKNLGTSEPENFYGTKTLAANTTHTYKVEEINGQNVASVVSVKKSPHIF